MVKGAIVSRCAELFDVVCMPGRLTSVCIWSLGIGDGVRSGGVFDMSVFVLSAFVAS